MILDLDETVYPSSTGLWDLIGSRIFLFIKDRLGLQPQDIHDLQYQYYNRYGTTLRGLVVNHGISARDYLDYVHAVPVEDYIHPDPELQHVLDAYSQRKIIFTNSDKKHSLRVLKRIGIDNLISEIVDIQDIDPHCKPQPEAFIKALDLIGIQNPAECLFIDDNLRNIHTAAELGMSVVYVHESGQSSLLYPTIRYLKDLPAVFPNGGDTQ